MSTGRPPQRNDSMRGPLITAVALCGSLLSALAAQPGDPAASSQIGETPRPGDQAGTAGGAPAKSDPSSSPPATGSVAPRSDDSQTPSTNAPVGSSFAESICLGLARASLESDIPIDFFTRLIWQESHFDPNAQSYAGAQGIAQFMPATARSRGLADPFDPLIAIKESARFLKELRDQFGNLGLAAAGYNAGPGRVRSWLDGHGPLPGQTRAYVQIITGRPVDTWVGVGDKPEDRMGSTISCDAIAKLLAPRGRSAVTNVSTTEPRAPAASWGLQLIGGSSQSRVLADYKHLQRKYPAILGNRPPLLIRSRIAPGGSATWYLVRVGEPTRERAMQLCARLEAAGGKCIVERN